jgi:hypothetical protein
MDKRPIALDEGLRRQCRLGSILPVGGQVEGCRAQRVSGRRTKGSAPARGAVAHREGGSGQAC